MSKSSVGTPLGRVAHVYDIVNCGPRKRFTANSVVVHNSEKLNLQNLPSGRVKGQGDALRAAITGTGKLTALDAKQIELRLTAFVANDLPTMEDIRDGRDPYLTEASAMYNIPYNDLLAMYTSQDKDVATRAKQMRQFGKSAMLGLGFRAGAKRYGIYCRTVSGLDIDDVTAKHHVELYRKRHWAVAVLWELCDSIIEAMHYITHHPSSHHVPDTRIPGVAFGGPNNDMCHIGFTIMLGQRVPYVQLPNGARLTYPGLRASINEYGRTNYTYHQALKADLNPRSPASNLHGGVLTENIIQAMGAQYLSHVAIAAKKQIQRLRGAPTGYRCGPSLVVHDELVYAGLDTSTIPFIEDAFRTGPSWLAGCPLDVDTETGDNYAFN